ncbi:MAG: acyloxyacyl hydrolase [Deltaproteobacteria bacterium]|jgi:hypothetical protein|nr:acyloxyacyl hydrolase [Deltaproteobacteria bacterium]
MRIFLLMVALTIWLPPYTVLAEAVSSDLELGVRVGFDQNNSSLDENYDAYEVYLLKDLPWKGKLSPNTSVSSRFDASLTYLDAADDQSAMVGFGLDFVLGFWNGLFECEVGFRPTWMIEHEYGNDDFGGGLQFTSLAGLAVHWQKAALNFRYQHTSNAGIYDENPGLNLMMVGLGYRF